MTRRAVPIICVCRLNHKAGDAASRLRNATLHMRQEGCLSLVQRLELFGLHTGARGSLIIYLGPARWAASEMEDARAVHVRDPAVQWLPGLRGATLQLLC